MITNKEIQLGIFGTPNSAQMTAINSSIQYAQSKTIEFSLANFAKIQTATQQRVAVQIVFQPLTHTK